MVFYHDLTRHLLEQDACHKRSARIYHDPSVYHVETVTPLFPPPHQGENEMDDSKENIPTIPTALLEALEKAMPPLRPAITWDERKIWVEVGRRDYLSYLRTIHDRQRE